MKYKTLAELVVAKFPKLSQQNTKKFARIVGSDSNLPEYNHCSNCGVKIDYGNYIIVGDYIFCGDKYHCAYHNNCRNILEEGESIPTKPNKKDIVPCATCYKSESNCPCEKFYDYSNRRLK